VKVVILCGGMGSRLKEETDIRPKPLVPVGERPILWHIMKHYSHFGFDEFVLALGYKGDMFREYFLNYQYLNYDFTIRTGENPDFRIHDAVGQVENWTITLADTGLNTLKGGRMKRIEKYLGADDDLFLMTYGDAVCDVDIREVVKFHRSHGKLVTLTGVIPTMRFGELNTKDDGSVHFREKNPQRAALVNGGYYVINRKLLNQLSPDESQDFEYGPLEELSDRGEVMYFRHEGFWHCMDNVRDLNALNQMWASNKAPWKIW
jgi:glucose-1-phosphate cytidylyltransferase